MALIFLFAYFSTPIMRRVINMKNNKKKTIRNGALVCGGVILLGASYFLGVKKGIEIGMGIFNCENKN